jgi:glycosyltransferase involved in cell wall biosynthesis
MKIIAISTMLNESDIVESLCRYTLLFCDGIIIFDTFSTDNTKDIIQKLIDEGLPIYLVDLSILSNTFGDIQNDMLCYAIQRFDADIIIPIDADEFLFCPDGKNPRTILETLDPQIEYRIPLRTFIFTQTPSGNTCFLPDFFPEHRVDEIQQYYKVVVSKHLCKTHNCILADGKHSLIYPKQQIPPVKNLDTLTYAHYPLRGIYHAMSKCLLSEFDLAMNWLNRESKGFQYQAAIDTIQKHGKLSVEDVKRLSIEYMITPPKKGTIAEHVKLINDPLKIPKRENKLTLRYTDYSKAEDKFFSTFFSSAKFLVVKNTKLLQKSQAEVQRLENSPEAIGRDKG